MIRNLTARDFLRVHTCDALVGGTSHALEGGSTLGQQARYDQVVFAKTVRNFWFTSTLNSVTETSAPEFFGAAYRQATSITPRFSRPIIVTDMLSLFEEPIGMADAGAGDNAPILFAQVTQYGGEGNAYGRDFFGLYNPIVSWLLLKHERNRQAITVGGVTSNELMDKYLPFVPRMLRPYETLKVNIGQSVQTLPRFQLVPHVGFRGFQVLPIDSPYAQLTPLADSQVRNYIKTASPETFFLEVLVSSAVLIIHGPRVIVTSAII